MICAKLLFVVCTTIYTIKLCVAENLLSDFNAFETDDEEKIKEALLLVELLKNEYGKRIRDLVKPKVALRSEDISIDNSTCRTTALSESEVQNITTNTTITNGTTTSADTINVTESTTEKTSTQQNKSEPENMPPFRRSLTQAIIPQYEYFSQPVPNNIQNDMPLDYYRRRNRFYRRKMPDYFYYYEEPSETHAQKLSMPSYDDPPRLLRRYFRRFQNNIDLQSKTQTATEATTIVTTPSSTTSVSLQNASDTATVPRKNLGKKHFTKSVFLQPDKKTTRIRKINKISVVRTKSDITTETSDNNEVKDPIVAEVASEYLRELNGTKTTSKKPKKKRTTLKLYLEGSTPYNLPLPANHAFCYTNPENALCRTYI